MRHTFRDFTSGWTSFTPSERRNISVYTLGIMIYKFGLEAFNGSISALATNRYDYDAARTGMPAQTFFKVGLLMGLNQAFQCVGAIAIAPLIRRFPTKNILAVASLVFSFFSALLLIVDAATGGHLVPEAYRNPGSHPEGEYSYYGRYNTDGMIPIYCVCGVVYGMVELIRRIIPRDIVGGNVQKLRKMDSLVHIFYEVMGTAGAFTTGLVLIPRLGNNMAFLVTPVCFAVAAGVWLFIRDVDYEGYRAEKASDTGDDQGNDQGNDGRRGGRVPAEAIEDGCCSGPVRTVRAVWHSFALFFESVVTGGRIIFTSRKFVWLLPGYSFALYAHRYLEGGVAPAVAKRYLGESAWSQIIVGGSNLGELLGALSVFLFTNVVKTPMPWLRIDALMLLVVWYLPYWRPMPGQISQAWVAAASLIPVSFGWAAGDVSLAAYIQASLARVEGDTRNVSALGAVMAFLYCTYIILVAALTPILGSYIDKVYADTGGDEKGGNIYEAIKTVAGAQFTIISIVVLAATFVPSGSWAFNPEMLYDERLDNDFLRDDDIVRQPEGFGDKQFAEQHQQPQQPPTAAGHGGGHGGHGGGCGDGVGGGNDEAAFYRREYRHELDTRPQGDNSALSRY